MRLFFFILTFLYIPLSAQTYNAVIDSLIQRTNIDTLISYVRILSGEDSIWIEGEKQRIVSREYDKNELAAVYLQNKLSAFGLSVENDQFNLYGENIIGVQTGIKAPNKKVFLTAHYDAVTNYCADDNASGVAAVLESARILSGYEFDYTIMYALWDHEEGGLFGSSHYASFLNSDDADVEGVINLDMIGWDNDNDWRSEIHTRSISNSVFIANSIVEVDSVYNVLIEPVIINPGTSASDHSSFWSYGFSAVLLIEAYYGNDFNPYYHSRNDRIDKFNIPYFHENTKLALAAAAQLACINESTGLPQIAENVPGQFSLSNYPNPFNNSTKISFSLPFSGYVTITIYDALGKKVDDFGESWYKAGIHEERFNADEMSSGIYMVVLKSGNTILTSKMLLVQ